MREKKGDDDLVSLYAEDLGLFRSWFVEVIRRHCGSIDRFYRSEKVLVDLHRHKRFKGLEYDVLLECKIVKPDYTRNIRIGIELKDKQHDKVFEQALERVKYVNYMYVALNLPVYEIIAILRIDRFKELFEKGIGVISMYDDAIVVKAYSKNHLMWAGGYDGLFKFIGENTGDVGGE